MVDVFGLMQNLGQTVKFFITVADDVKTMKNAPKDVKEEIDAVANTAGLVQDCLLGIYRLKQSGYDISPGLEEQLTKTVKALESVARYLRSTLNGMESSGVAVNVAVRLRYLWKGKECMKTVVDRAESKAVVLFHRFTLQCSLYSSSKRYLPFVNAAWEHSRTEGNLPSWEKTVLKSSLKQLPYTDEIALGDPKDSYEGVIFVKRGSLATKVHTERLYKMLSVKGFERQRGRLGLLECIGYANVERSSEMDPDHHKGDYHILMFQSPDMTNAPITLRELLLRNEAQRHKLSERLAFALTLTTSVVVNHSLGIIHKFISPESIVVCSKIRTASELGEQYDLGTPYILAFDEARTETMTTTSSGVATNAKRRFYCHPDHQMEERRRPFEVKDDIIGLGICLLEIGLWRSFFVKEKGFYGSQSETSEEKLVLNDEARKMGIAAVFGSPEAEIRFAAWQRVAKLKELALKELPRVMGDSYTEAVVACLDPDHEASSQMLLSGPQSHSGTGDADGTSRPDDNLATNLKFLRRQYLRIKAAFRGSSTLLQSLWAVVETGCSAEQTLAGEDVSEWSIPAQNDGDTSLAEVGESGGATNDLGADSSSNPRDERGSSALAYSDAIKSLSLSASHSVQLVTEVLKKLESIKM
ncbi:hypothetical protein SCHPADRAFT_926910 [Schizopora paradoxa]|uniref:Protein kinase domain-containing protein n=1 Tax=Schizopora paradoxa TaxID=27342 RepID=A0A0H2RW96_9AGAM|nr:hypothetical protein SCHPADRAFT_926910 [Schizopora paradoxa]